MEYGSKELEKGGGEASQHVISQTVQKSFGIVMALKKAICVFTAGNIYGNYSDLFICGFLNTIIITS